MPFKDAAKRKAYLRAYHQRWYEANKTERLKQIKKYQRDNRESIRAYMKTPNVRKRLAAAKRKWRDKNRERDNRNRRFWTKSNRERVSAYNRRSYLRRQATRRADNAKWRENNREYSRVRQRHMHQMRNGQLSDEQFEKIKKVRSR